MIARRGIGILAVLMLLSGLFFSQSVDAFTAKNFDSDAALQKSALTSGGVQYTLIQSDGKDMFIVDQSGNAVLDSAKISQILKDDLMANSGYSAKVSQAKSDMNAFEATRQVGDAYCHQLTGTTSLPATNAEEAKTACQANPNCQAGLYNAQNSMELVTSWYTNSSAVASDVSAFVQNADSLSSSKSAVDSELALLTKIESEVSNMESNLLFKTQIGEGGYEYCPKINYSSDKLASIRSSLAAMSDVQSQISQADGRASALLANSNAQLNYSANRVQLSDALKKKALSESAQIRLDFESLNANVQLSAMEPSIALLEEYSANISNLEEQGKYAKAIALEKPFDQLFADTDSSLNSLKTKYAALTASVKSEKAKIASAKLAVSGDALTTLAGLDAQVSAIEGKTKGQMSTGDISSYSSQLASIDTQVNGVVAQAALSGNTRAPASMSQPAGAQSASIAGMALPAFLSFIPQEYVVGAVVVAVVAIIIALAIIMFVVKKLFFSKGRKQDDAKGKSAKEK